jgi:hypothetical protein
MRRSARLNPKPCATIRRSHTSLAVFGSCVSYSDVMRMPLDLDKLFVRSYGHKDCNRRPDSTNGNPKIPFIDLISPKHATIVLRGARCYIIDTSKHGTYIGQTLIPTGKEIEIPDGDVFSFGAPYAQPTLEGDSAIVNPFSYRFLSVERTRAEEAFVTNERTRERLRNDAALLEGVDESLRSRMLCAVCCDFMQAPCVVSGCGHTFCYKCIRTWFEKFELESPTCPTCRAEPLINFGSAYPQYTPCFSTEALIHHYIDPLLDAASRTARAEVTSYAFRNMRARNMNLEDGETHTTPARHCNDYSLWFRSSSTRHSAPCVSGSSVVSEKLCVSCTRTIPPGCARIVCNFGLADELHVHGAYPCYSAAFDEILVGGLKLLPELSSQEMQYYRTSFGKVLI